MHHLKEIKLWHKAIELSIRIYKIVSTFPLDEKYGLISQIKRASISIASNIAEGAGRNSINEFIHFLGIANGSSYELLTQIVIANKLALIADDEAKRICEQIEELQKMNYGFQKRLKNKI